MLVNENIDIQFAMADLLPMGVCVLAEDYEIVFWNKTLEQWTGIEREAMVGTALSDRFEHLGNDQYKGRFQAVLAGGPPAVFSAQFHPHILPIALSKQQMQIQHTMMTSMAGETGQPLVLMVIQDVTALTLRVFEYRRMHRHAMQEIEHRHEAERILTHQKDELSRSNTELEQYAYAIAHDLQAPVRKIINFTDLLSKKSPILDEKGQMYLQYISKTSRRIHQLIRDLFEYSKAGRTEAVPEWWHLNDIVDEVLSYYQDVIKRLDAKVNCHGMKEIFVNRDHVIQILKNLVSNALKYHGKDRLILDFALEESEDAWTVSVQDNGIGIENQYQERIFNIFQRLHTDEEYSGTGIGLAICKKIVERSGGRIWFEAPTDQGVKFLFTVPMLIGL